MCVLLVVGTQSRLANGFSPHILLSPFVSFSFSGPALRRQAFECVQNAGELLYVPTLFYHYVVNIETSIGVAHEVGHNDEGFLAKALVAAREAVTSAPSGAPRALPE